MVKSKSYAVNFNWKISMLQDDLTGIQKVLEWYQSIVKNFGKFCLFYFSILQSLAIFVTFVGLSMLMSSEYDFLSLISVAMGSVSHILSLYLLTEAFDTSYQNILSLKHHLKQKLLTAKDKAERTQLKYIQNWMNDIGPMNANGYFIIDKSTLTSMLSVRYW